MTSRMSSVARWLFLATFLSGCLAADDGDDFSNNLFSDLAPLLALFGERVTMQFMSQSMGWADNIILAMAPLGIVTAIVAAIRVGGPSWLRAVIGRARENLAVSEAELMSSTSKEVCEVWNGQEVVRCMGLAPVVEFICLLQYTDDAQSESREGPMIEVLELKEAIRKDYIKHLDPDAESTSMNEQFWTNGQSSSNEQSSTNERSSTNEQPSSNDLSSTNESTPTNEPAPESQPGPEPEPDFRRHRGSREPIGDEEQANPRPDVDPQCRPQGPSPTIAGSHPEPQKPIRRLQKVCIIWNEDSDSPNISLNCHPPTRGWELRVFAAFGTILQLGVLIYSGLATYHPALKFRKDDKPVQDYAYPCTAVGTIVLVFGMLLCSYVVESSTDEKRYQASDEWKTRIVWLQQTKTVSDQVFESCMVYAKDNRQTITTSRRMKRYSNTDSTDKNKGGAHSTYNHNPSAFLQLVTIAGTAISLCGFVLQFVGLRGMHWSASVVQLGAVLVMVGVKAWVRRGLASSPAFEPLSSGFELDSFVKSLGVLHQEPWSGLQNKRGGLSPDKRDFEDTRSRKDWTVTTGGESSFAFSQTRPTIPSSQDESVLNAQSIVEIREQLAGLAYWRGPASSEAVSLARSIECTVAALKDCLPRDWRCLTWNLETRYGLRSQTISIQPKFMAVGWEVDAGEVEAILTLWLSSVPEEESKIETFIRVSGQKTGDDEWLRSEGTAKGSLRLLGDQTPSLARDLRWWVPRHLLNLTVYEVRGSDSLIIPKHRRVGFTQSDGEGLYLTGFDDDSSLEDDSDSDTEDPTIDDKVNNSSDQAEGPGSDHSNSASSSNSAADEVIVQNKDSIRKLLGTVSHQSLKSLYAMDLYSSFMRAVAKAMVQKIPGEAEKIQTSDTADDESWKVFSLRNTHLSKLIQDVHNTGLGSLEQTYLSVIVSLSIEDKLPGVSAVVNLALQKSKQNEQSQRWQEAGDDLIWLSQLANTTFKSQSPVVEEAAANLIEYLRLTDRILKWKTPCDSDEFGSFGISTRDLQKLHSKLQKELRDFDLSLREPIETKAKMIGLMQADTHHGAEKEARSLAIETRATKMDTRDVLHRTATHYAAFTGDLGLLGGTLVDKHQINAQDILGRTAMHYACASSSQTLEMVHLMLARGADPNIRARDGATALHYAAMSGKQDVAEALVEAGATVDIADLSGGSPFHTAAAYGHVPVVQYLWGKVKRDLRGQSGWTVLQLVALLGKEEVARFLVDSGADQKAKDRSGRTALHLAVEAENLSVLKVLLKGQPDLEAEDHFGMTALSLAVDAEHHKMVECLIEAGANTGAEGYLWKPIELAVKDGHEAIVHLLLHWGSDCHGKKRNGVNLLHVASKQSNINLVKEFLKRGVDVNSKGYADMSPLHYAARCGILSNGRLLLRKGANTEQVDVEGRTPLWYATKEGHAKFVQVLLYRGASVEKNPDIHGKTILDMAEASGDKRVLQLLQRHLQQHRTTVASPTNSSAGTSSGTDDHAGPSLSSGGLSTGDGV